MNDTLANLQRACRAFNANPSPSLAAAIDQLRAELVDLQPGTPACDVLSIDAWRDDGGWQWNNWHKVARVPRAWCDLKPRALFAALRHADLLGDASRGKVEREDDGYNVVILARGTREPIFALAYGAERDA